MDYLEEDFWNIKLEEHLREHDIIPFSWEDITSVYVLGRMDAYKDFKETGEGSELFDYYNYDYLKKTYGEYAEY